MVHPWIEDYIRLALRMDKPCWRIGGWLLVDFYHGPDSLRLEVEQEAEWPLSDLVRATMTLGDRLQSQGFEAGRAAYLEKQLVSMEMVCRLLDGQEFGLEEAVPAILDVAPVCIPESEMEENLAMLDRAGPGPGNVRERFQAWQIRTELPRDDPQKILQVMQQIVTEARRRTRSLVELPEGERFELDTVQDKPFGAANWYQSDYYSRIELNVDRPIHLFTLAYQMCHEGYPGHHTEAVMKEKCLVRERGWVEHTMGLFGPGLVVSEGMASLAAHMIFTPSELVEWAGTDICPDLDISWGDVDAVEVVRAGLDLLADELASTLVTLLREGKSEEEVLEYAMDLTPYTEQQILHGFLEPLRSPILQIYSFSYSAGKRLLAPRLLAPEGNQLFRRLVCEPVGISQIESGMA